MGARRRYLVRVRAVNAEGAGEWSDAPLVLRTKLEARACFPSATPTPGARLLCAAAERHPAMRARALGPGRGRSRSDGARPCEARMSISTLARLLRAQPPPPVQMLHVEPSGAADAAAAPPPPAIGAERVVDVVVRWRAPAAPAGTVRSYVVEFALLPVRSDAGCAGGTAHAPSSAQEGSLNARRRTRAHTRART